MSDTVIALLVTLVINVCLVAFSYGKVSSKLDNLCDHVAKQNGRIGNTEKAQQNVEQRVKATEVSLEYVSRDINDLKERK